MIVKAPLIKLICWNVWRRNWGYTKQKAPFITKRGRFEPIQKGSHNYSPYHHGIWNDYNHPVNNQPTHPYQNHQMHTKDFARLNSTGNISTNQNQASENSENNDIRLLLESHAKITALIFQLENSK